MINLTKWVFLLIFLLHARLYVVQHGFIPNEVNGIEGGRRASAGYSSSSETQGQLVGTTGFLWAKVYNKSGRAPGHLLLPNEFQKRLKSRLLIGQKNFFLVNQRRGTAGRLSGLLTRGCFPHQSP